MREWDKWEQALRLCYSKVGKGRTICPPYSVSIHLFGQDSFPLDLKPFVKVLLSMKGVGIIEGKPRNLFVNMDLKKEEYKTVMITVEGALKKENA